MQYPPLSPPGYASSAFPYPIKSGHCIKYPVDIIASGIGPQKRRGVVVVRQISDSHHNYKKKPESVQA